MCFAVFFFFFKILFDREIESTSRQRGRQREREKQAPRQAGSPMRDPIPGPRDHDPSRRQPINRLSHAGAPKTAILKFYFILNIFDHCLLTPLFNTVFQLVLFKILRKTPLGKNSIVAANAWTSSHLLLAESASFKNSCNL